MLSCKHFVHFAKIKIVEGHCCMSSPLLVHPVFFALFTEVCLTTKLKFLALLKHSPLLLSSVGILVNEEYEADVMESCRGDGIIRKVQGSVTNESDDESQQTEKLLPPPVNATIKYIKFLNQLVCSNVLSDEIYSALKNLETTIIGSD